MAETELIRILVCFDCPVLQAGLVATLARHADFDCSELPRAGSKPDRLPMPDVIVADAAQAAGWLAAGIGGTDRQVGPPVLVIAHSARENEIRAALCSGVQGYLLIDDVPRHLAAAVRTVRPGLRFLSPQIASRLAENLSLESLTCEEEAVLNLVVEGLCNKGIGRQLGITTGTVKSHLRSTFGKLGVTSRTQAIAIVHRRGLLGSMPDATASRPASQANAICGFDSTHRTRALAWRTASS